MSANKRRRCHRGARQTGVLVVEFALVAIILFTLLFGVLEVARAMYLWNTLQEVTRRAADAAAMADFTDEGAKDLVRQAAVFRAGAGPGLLMLGTPVTDASVHIDYMSLARNGNGSMAATEIPAGALPACPARNRVNCTADPYANNCVRLVRVRICAATSAANACDPLPYVPLVSLTSLSVNLPSATSIVPAGNLGFQPGMPLCP